MKRCAREGCDRSVPAHAPGTYKCCGFVCRAAHTEHQAAQRISEAIGVAAADDLIVLAARVNAALDDYQAREHELFEAALEVGLTSTQWRAIREGRSV